MRHNRDYSKPYIPSKQSNLKMGGREPVTSTKTLFEQSVNAVSQTQDMIFKTHTSPRTTSTPSNTSSLVVRQAEREEKEDRHSDKHIQEKIFDDIKETICSASLLLDEASNREIAIVLGNTRSGKSTLVNYLIGSKLTSKRDSETQKVYVTLKVDGSGAGIGLSAQSQTSIPAKYKNTKIQGLDLWDTPGFGDSRGPEVDIPNAFYIRELLVKAKSVKIILVSDYNDLYGDNIEHFCRFLNTITTIFPDIRVMAGAVSVVFTKVIRDVFEAAKEENTTVTDVIVSTLKKKILDSGTNTQGWYNSIHNLNEARYLVTELVNNKDKIGVFKTVHRVKDTLSDKELDYNILDSVEASLPITKLENLRIGISEQSLLFLKNCYDKISDIGDLEMDLDRIEKVYNKEINRILQRIDYESDLTKLKNIKQENIIDGKIKVRLNTVNNVLTDKTKSTVEALLEFAAIDLELKARIEQSDTPTKQKLIDFIQLVMHSAGITDCHKDIIKIALVQKVVRITTEFDSIAVRLEYRLGIITKEECKKVLAQITEQEVHIQKDLDNIKKELEEVNKAVKDTSSVAGSVGLGLAVTPLAIPAAPFITLGLAYEGAKETMEGCNNLAGKVAISSAFIIGGLIAAALSPVVALLATAPAMGAIANDDKKELKAKEKELLARREKSEEETKKYAQEKERVNRELERTEKQEYLLKELVNQSQNQREVLSTQKKQGVELAQVNAKINKNTKAVTEISKTLNILTEMQKKVDKASMSQVEKFKINDTIESLKQSIKIISEKVSNQDPSIMQKVVEELTELSSKKEFDNKMLLNLNKKVKSLEKQLKEQVTVVNAVTEIVYYNELLNHPELFKEACKMFGLNKTLNLCNSLSIELIEEAEKADDVNIILAGLSSLEFS